MTPITRLLEAVQRGEPHAAVGLFPAVYDELRALAAAKLAHEQPGHTLNATALVHEAYLRLVGEQHFDGRGHFFAAAAEAMRRILVDHARTRLATKRGGGAIRLSVDLDGLAKRDPDDELLALDEALNSLSAAYPEHAELVKLRYFAGLSADEAAATLGLSPSTADRRWTFARAWLRGKIADPATSLP
jgi:RNA polymerase sigma factor (TIGR02999 family)